MTFQPSFLWRLDGEVDRRPYLVTGVVAFAVKHGLDLLVAGGVFSRPWGLLTYLLPLVGRDPRRYTPGEDALFYSCMLALALPFIWIGVALTVRRLRSAGLPVWLVMLFFLPFVNIVLIAVLCVWPPARPVAAEASPTADPGPRPWLLPFLDHVLPIAPGKAAVMAVLLPLPLTLGTVFLGVHTFATYGWGLFIAAPFCLGLISVLLYGYAAPRTLLPCLGVATVSTLVLALGLVGAAIEGAICVILALPLATPLAMAGGAIGYVMQRRPERREGTGWVVPALLLVCPLLMGAEAASDREPPLLEAVTVVEIDAPPEVVWRHVIAFSEIAPPEEWLFRAGVAYPIRAEMHGHGVGAERHCVFSTGAFVEPIVVWDEPHRLEFLVLRNPPPMEEWTPYARVRPPHLEGYFLSRRGRFELVPLPGGRTRLEGTTWYQHHLWPSVYWEAWSGAVIHRIHGRVLRHIRDRAEAPR